MGSGATAYSIAWGTTTGQAAAMREHEQAMIPILKEKGEMELELQKKAFEQAKGLGLLENVIEKQQPIFVPGTPAAAPAISNWLLYAAIGIGVYFLLIR